MGKKRVLQAFYKNGFLARFIDTKKGAYLSLSLISLVLRILLSYISCNVLLAASLVS